MNEFDLRAHKIWAWCVGLVLGLLVLGATAYNTSYWYFITAYGYQQNVIQTTTGQEILWQKTSCDKGIVWHMSNM